jgi:peptidoglycan biosynthesis protein MviN/MurJ (putative lipid II flippase)
VRSFYASQNARIPMIVSASGFVIYLGLAIPLMGWMSFSGIAMANSLSYSIQAVILVLLLNRYLPERFKLKGTIIRGVISALLAGVSAWLVMTVLPIPLPALVLALVAMVISAFSAAVPIWGEIRLLVQL